MDNVYIEKVLNGETESFRYFIKTYKDYAFSLAFSILKNEYLAEEALQEAYIKVFENLRQFRKESNFKTWFGRIVINESLRRVNNNHELINLDDISEDQIGIIEDSLTLINQNDQKNYISMVFEDLNPQTSLVLDLFHLKEYSLNEIEALTGWTKSKIKMLLSRGRKSFYLKLSKLLRHELKEMVYEK